ncbi:hypothetical protein MMC30_003904 [Trapelia coarctata]|nr:hypothetical protein [Trapelia coarctata]
MSPFFGSKQSGVRYRSSVTPFPTQAAYSKKSSRFELLPFELRQEIYAYLGYEVSPAFEFPLPNLHKPSKTELKVKFWYDLHDNTLQDTAKRYQNVQVAYQGMRKCPNPHSALLTVSKTITGELYDLTYGKSIFTFHYDIASALERSPEKSPFMLGTRALAYLTHVVLGPIQAAARRIPVISISRKRLREPIYDAERLPALITSVHLISRHCRHLEMLGVCMWNLDVIRSLGQLPTLTKAICSAVQRSSQLKWVFISIGVKFYGSFNLDALQVGTKEKTEHLAKWTEAMWSKFMYLTEDHHRDGVPNDD